MHTPVLARADRCPKATVQSNHCFHHMTTSTWGEPQHGYDEHQCCFCGYTERRFWRLVPDEQHGSHVPHTRKLGMGVYALP